MDKKDKLRIRIDRKSIVNIERAINFQDDPFSQLLMNDIRAFNEHERRQREYRRHVQERH